VLTVCRGANFCARTRMAHMACPYSLLLTFYLRALLALLFTWRYAPVGGARKTKQPDGLLPSCSPSSNGRRPCRARVIV
jgi:hypothetical protein